MKRRRDIIVPASLSPHDRRPIRAETRATLVASIARGRRWLDEVVAGTVTNVEQIAAHLDDRFRLLTSGSRTALPRQQTLRSLIDWSHALLTEPECVLFLTGPGEDRAAVREGIRAIADAGRRHGVRTALEPIQREFAHFWTTVSSLDEAAALVDEAGADVGLMYDAWHLWREPLAEIERHRDRIYGVHLADWRDPTRSTNDRVLPGDGVVDFAPILDALRWDGLYDLEIFSDADLAESLWTEPPRDLARRGIAKLEEALSTASA